MNSKTLANNDPFEFWWWNEGSAMRPLNGEDAEAHTYRITKIAWSNGAYCAPAQLGRLGGKATSPAKTDACRANAKRPRPNARKPKIDEDYHERRDAYAERAKGLSKPQPAARHQEPKEL